MPLIIRIDVDRPYGKRPLWRHLLSRAGSDAYFPAVDSLGYLRELSTVLQMLNEHAARSHVFFRRCTLPSRQVLELIDKGHHLVGVHLEDSRNISTFREEKRLLESHLRRPVALLSKHGSGGHRYGRHHHAPYEPEKYESWCAQSGIRYFLGNLEDPGIASFRSAHGDVCVFPAAFWLEPAWRDKDKFPFEWLLDHARHSDVVLLIHPENVLASELLTQSLIRLLRELKTKALE